MDSSKGPSPSTPPPSPPPPPPTDLIPFSALPPWRQDNHYILTSHRQTSNSCLRSLYSLTYLHNESVNIYTHLLPAIISLSWSFSFPDPPSSCRPRLAPGRPLFGGTLTTEEASVWRCFFLGAMLCLGISAAYHTLSNHSPHVNRWGNQADYVGIVALIAGSFVPSVYYGFHDEPALRKRYWAMIATLAAMCTTVSLAPKFRSPGWRPFRAAMFVGMGSSAVVPVLHGLKLYGVEEMRGRMGLAWVILQGFLYVLGAGLYAARVPERWRPGQFDIWGSSHQIFHVLVVLAAISHLTGLIRAHAYWSDTLNLEK